MIFHFVSPHTLPSLATTLIRTSAVVLMALGVSCKSLPSEPHTAKSKTLTKSVLQIHQNLLNQQLAKSHLALAVNEQSQVHPTLSGYYPISTGSNAFAARSILSGAASHVIDVQYYIWHDDEAGQLMLKDLWMAAERGVLVRVLIDDLNSNENLDQILVRFAEHPNIAVRIVNPMVYRNVKFLNYLLNPSRSNIRMHNKSMTFDNELSIIGGRNIGDEYLNNTESNQFADLDVLLVGSVVKDITKSFDEYWDSPYAYDIETLVRQKGTLTTLPDFSRQVLAGDLDAYTQADDDERALFTYRQAITSSTIGQDLLNKKLPFRWVNIDFIADPASKLSADKDQDRHKDRYLIEQLRAKFGVPKERLSIISSYFVPTKEGVDTLVELAQSGVDIRILTNSFDATDVGVVHAGYAHWRHDLLRAGIKLYELKSTATNEQNDENKFWRTRNQTTTSLHAKAFAVDNHQVFIGSYNVDPRSANINTETGVIINDNHLARHLHDAMEDKLLNQAYEVRLDGDALRWHTLDDGVPVTLTAEPQMNTSERALVFLMGLMPIDWLL